MSFDPYLALLLIGAGGLATMAFLGGGHHGGHAGGHAVGHAGGHAGHVADHHVGHAPAHDPAHAHHTTTPSRATAWLAWLSPRVLLSLALGAGATGLVARSWLVGPLLMGAALGGALVLELVCLRPLWNLAFRFAGQPAAMLDTTLYERATVVTPFDADGYGVVAVPLDGQVRQVLARLPQAEREGPRLRSGAAVRVIAVDAAAQRVTVSRDLG